MDGAVQHQAGAILGGQHGSAAGYDPPAGAPAGASGAHDPARQQVPGPTVDLASVTAARRELRHFACHAPSRT